MKSKRFLACLLCSCLVFSSMPVSAAELESDTIVETSSNSDELGVVISTEVEENSDIQESTSEMNSLDEDNSGKDSSIETDSNESEIESQSDIETDISNETQTDECEDETMVETMEETTEESMEETMVETTEESTDNISVLSDGDMPSIDSMDTLTNKSGANLAYWDKNSYTLYIEKMYSKDNGYPWKEDAYKYAAKKVVFYGDDLYTICSSALKDFTVVTEIDITAPVNTIKSEAFSGCTSLKNINFSNDKLQTVEKWAFYNCKKLTEIDLPNSLTTIGVEAFEYCTSLETITGAKSVSSIGDSAFRYCAALTTFNFPSVETIGTYAFSECNALTTVTLPDTLKSVGTYAFYRCSGLKRVEASDSSITINEHAFKECTSLKEVSLSSVVAIDKYVFYGCSSLTTINIPKVTTIEYQAFYNCTSLENVSLPEVRSIGAQAFYGCTGLKTLELSDTLGDIGISAFYNCKNLSDVTWHENAVSSIGNTAFYNCEKLTNVYLPSVADIGESSFQNCKGITSVKLSSELKTIGKNAFQSCTALKTVEGTDSVTSIGLYAFQKCENLTSISLKSIREFSKNAFDGCKALKTVELSDELTNIADYVFQNCTNLTTINMPTDLLTIGLCAFKGCTNLASVTIPDSVTTISNNAFNGCTSLTDITIGSGVTTIGTTAFGGVKDLKTKLTTDNQTAKGYDWYGSGRYFYDLKVYDKYGDVEPELREWVKISNLAGQNYEYYAKTKDKYELTSADRFAGTATQDTDIIFTYKYQGIILVVNDEFYDIDGNFESAVTRLSKEYTKATKVTVKALTTAELAKANKSGYVLGSDEQNQTTVNMNSSQTVTFKYYRQPSVIEVDADTDTTAPQLKEYNISMNLYKETLPTIELTNSSEYTLKSYEIVDAKGIDAGFSLTKISDSQFELDIDAGYTKKIKAGNTYNLYLQIATIENKTDIYNIPIVIQVVKEKPTVSVTQGDVLNLYDKNGTGTLNITSNADISGIDFVSKAKSGTVRLEQDTNNTDITDTTAVFKYILADENASNFAKANAGGKLIVKFKGYKDEAAYTSNITLKVNKTLPKLTLEAMTLYTGTAKNTADVKIIDSTTGKDVTDEYDIEQTGNVPAKYSIDGSSVTADTGAKNTTIKWNITHDNWYGKTAASLKVTVKTKPVLTFSNTKAVLNVNGSPIEITPQIAGINDSDITVESIVGKDNNSKSALDNGLSLTADKGKITVKVDKSKYTATGTKKYNFTVTASTVDFEDITATLSVSVTNAATDVTIKSTGKLDLLDRTGSSIAYKFTVKNNISEIKNVELTNYTDKFNLAYTNGTATLTAIQGAPLEVRTAKNPYVLTFKITLANGDNKEKTVKVTPTQKAPALVGTKATFYKNATGSKYAKTISITGKSTTVDITNITLTDSYNGAFVYTYDNGGNGTLYINKTKAADLKFKSYSLKFQVTLKDSGAPITVTIPVKYSK